MAEMTIRLQIDPETGKKDIIVILRSEDDSLPHEHEQQHKALVDKLIEGGIVKAGELGKIRVEREEEEVPADVPLEQNPQTEDQSLSEGN